MNIYDMKIVSIDDNENNLYFVEALCNKMGLKVKSFSDSVEALEYVIKNPVDMIIIDYMMPNLNGMEFTKKFRERVQDIPILMITVAGNNDDIHKEAFISGVNDFLSKPVNSTLFEVRVNNLLVGYQNKLLLKDRAKLLEKEVKKATEDLVNRERETLNILGKLAEYRDPETSYHISRVANYSKMIAREYGLNIKEQELIFYSSPFHDLGKIGIEDNILLKPGKLTESEFNIMKNHAIIGYEILKDSNSNYLQAGALVALHHHEKYDGSGYPNGLKGEDIHIYGRIVSVADVFDALTSKRPYKEAWTFDEALNLLKEESGKHFDPKIVKIFEDNLEEVMKIYKTSH